MQELTPTVKMLIIMLFFVSLLNPLEGKTKVLNFYKSEAGYIVQDFVKQSIGISIEKPSSMLHRAFQTLHFDKNPTYGSYLLGNASELCIQMDLKISHRLSLMQDELLVDTSVREHINRENITIFIHNTSFLGRSKRGVFSLMRKLFTSGTSRKQITSTIKRKLSSGRFYKKLGSASLGIAADVAITAIVMKYAFPDRNYDDIINNLDLLKQTQDSLFLDSQKLALAVTQNMDNSRFYLSEIRDIVSTDGHITSTLTSLKLLIDTYIEDLFYSLSRYQSGILSDFLMDLPSQKEWLRSFLSFTDLITTISPTLPISQKTIDPVNFVIYFDVAVPTSMTPTLISQWEPALLVESECYSSPHKNMFLRLIDNDTQIIPEIYHGDSCFFSGIILCEKDGKILNVPDLKKDPSCTSRIKRGISLKNEIEEQIGSILAKQVEIGRAEIFEHPLGDISTRQISSLMDIKDKDTINHILQHMNESLQIRDKKWKVLHGNQNFTFYLSLVSLFLGSLLGVLLFLYFLRWYVTVRNQKRLIKDIVDSVKHEESLL